MVGQVPDAENGFLSYRILPTIMDRHPSADGFFVVNDDCLLNYWNLKDADLTKIWFGVNPWVLEIGKRTVIEWSTTEDTQSRVAKAYEAVPLPYLVTLRSILESRCIAGNIVP